MSKKWLGSLLACILLFLNLPVQAASVSAATLLQVAQKTGAMLEREAPPEEIMVQTELMAKMLTKFDFSQTDITLEGLQSLSSEMLGLKLRLASVQYPDRVEVKRQVERLIAAFDSLANPQAAAWKQTVKEMSQLTDKLLVALANNNRPEVRRDLQALLATHSRIQIALELNVRPEQVNLLISAASFLKQQEQMTEPDGMKEALQQYKTTLEEIGQKPPAVTTGLKKKASSYNAQSWWIAAVLLASSGYLIYRRVTKTH